MDLGIAGRTALVLGAAGGLGSAIAGELASEGANLAVADRNGAGVTKTAQRLVSAGGNAIAVDWDLSDLSAIESKIAAVEEKLGPVEILVNITGGPPPGQLRGLGSNTWLDHFRMMVLSVAMLTDRVLPSMLDQKWGRVITSTSSGVVSPIPDLGLSNSLRSSLVSWSKTLAREVGKWNVTCNVIVPGRIATGRIRALDEARAQRQGKDIDEIVSQSTTSIPLGRYGRPEEYAKVVAFLASEAASYITGSLVRVDGGLIQTV